MSVPTDPRPANRWHSFFKGWQDGCACKPRRPEFTGSANPDVREPYENGFEAGVGDRRKTQHFATLQYGYSPTVLREATISATPNASPETIAALGKMVALAVSSPGFEPGCCPRDGDPCEHAGDGTRCCDRQP